MPASRLVRRIPRFLPVLMLLSALPGCIIVATKDSDYVRIEEKKADAQYLAARAELERVNLERQKAGLAPIEIPTKAPPSDCDDEHPQTPTSE